MNKQEILARLRTSFDDISVAATAVSEANFNVSKNEKWTAGENVQHIIVSARMTTLAYTLPKIFPALLYGKAKQPSRSYDEVVTLYQSKLQAGGKAMGPYVPKKVDYKKDIALSRLSAAAQKLLSAVEGKWSDGQLDEYRIAHPLLGKMTARELLYFTIYHNGHHAQTVRELYA